MLFAHISIWHRTWTPVEIVLAIYLYYLEMGTKRRYLERGTQKLERFGKFELLEKIGEGGMAEIYLARPIDASFSKLVAVKRLLPQFSDDPSFYEMFRREGAIGMRFRNPAIIAVYEMGAIDSRSYISMEYFPGKTLARVMGRMRDSGQVLSVLDKITIVKKIAEALHYIHEFNDYGEKVQIIHRDISPHNIMIGFNGVTKLIDFGIAKEAQTDTTQSRSIKGKVAYMSPEQVRGDILTRHTDIFSLGIVFWELLAKKKLFTGKTIQEVTAKVSECRVPSLSDRDQAIPPEISRICLKMLTAEPALRYQTAGQVAQDLNDFLRLASAEGREKSIARMMKTLFPEELSQLRHLLKIHEGTQDGLLSPNATAKMKTTKLGRRARLRGRAKDSLAVPLVAIALAGMMIYNILPAVFTKYRAMTAPSVASTQASSTLPSAPVHASSQAAGTAESARPNYGRNPATNWSWASVTINAEPKSRIWVNGKLAGNSQVRAMQVPADQPVKIRILAKGAKKAKNIQFIPYGGSQNFIDVSK